MIPVPIQLGPIEKRQTVRFGRVGIWHDDSGVSLAAAVSLALVLFGFHWIVTLRAKRHPVALVTVAMQPLLVDADGLLGGTARGDREKTETESEFDSLRDSQNETVDSELTVPDLPQIEVQLKKLVLVGKDVETLDAALSRTAASLQKAEQLLKSRSSEGIGDPATARFFGLGEEGANSVVYVIDCSLSMDQPSYKFELAKRELIRSINSLQSEHRFYVIFFAGVPVSMPGSELVSATEDNKERAITWIKGVGVLPNTVPVPAMRDAIRLRPEVIYLLSDGEFVPQYCDEIRAANRGSSPATIYTVGFGNRSGEAQLLRIANESGGKYRYVEFVQRR